MDSKDAPQLIEHIHHSLNCTPFVTRWIPQTANLLLLGETPRSTGTLTIFSLEESSLAVVHKNESEKSSFKSGQLFRSRSGSLCLAAGHRDGTLSLWDLTNTREPISKIQAHRGAVNAVDAVSGSSCAEARESGNGSPLLATGGADGCARVWDTRDNTQLLSLEPAEGEDVADCWAIAFGDAHEGTASAACVASGYDNGDVKLFDMRTGQLQWDANLDYGVCHLQFDRKDIPMNKLAISCLEGHLFMADMRTCHPEEGYAKRSQKLSESTIWGAHFIPQNRELFAVAAGSGTVRLYKYSYPKQRSIVEPDTGMAKGVVGTLELLNDREASTQPLISFDWHPNKLGLCAFASLDQALRVYIVTKLHLY